ncbi:MAG: hypothetical protein U0528_16160 [Anaerolineae bacterium]|nr:hypothetical protein [Anaerolineae bacterium]
MVADWEEMQRIHRRVERRVRGELIFRAHRAFAIFCSAIAVVALLSDPNRHYLVGPVVAIFVLFAFTLGVHTMLRRFNRTADELREREMQRELQRAGYYGEIEKRKREAAMVAHLSDDGELIYADDDQQQTSAASSYN